MFKPPFYSQFVLTDEQLMAIGCVAVESAFLEHQIEAAIWNLCSFDDQTGRVFTDRPMLDARLDILRDLINIKIKDKAALSKFKVIFDQIKDALPKRNTIIHGLWQHWYKLSEIEPGATLSNNAIATRKKLKGTPEPVAAKQVMSVAAELSRLYAELSNFHLRYIPLRGLPNKDG